MAIFRPIIPFILNKNYTREKLFYEGTYINTVMIWSSLSLVLMFSFSAIIMNVSFAIYYNNRFYHDVLIGISIIFLILSILLQCVILYKNKDKSIYVMWKMGLMLWQTTAFILFIIFFPYERWNIDNNFPETSFMCNVFYLVQFVPTLLTILGCLCYGSFLLLKKMKSCCNTCREEIKHDIKYAQNKVNGYQQGLDNNIVLSTDDERK